MSAPARLVQGGDIPEVFTDPTVAPGYVAPIKSRLRFGARVYEKYGPHSTNWVTYDAAVPAEPSAATRGFPAFSTPITLPGGALIDFTFQIAVDRTGNPLDALRIFTHARRTDGTPQDIRIGPGLDIDVNYGPDGSTDDGVRVILINNTFDSIDVYLKPVGVYVEAVTT